MDNKKKLQVVLGGTSGMGLATAIALGLESAGVFDTPRRTCHKKEPANRI